MIGNASTKAESEKFFYEYTLSLYLESTEEGLGESPGGERILEDYLTCS